MGGSPFEMRQTNNDQDDQTDDQANSHALGAALQIRMNKKLQG